MKALRSLRHVLAEGSARRQFPPRVLDAIQKTIAEDEGRHAGQVLFAAEGAMPVHDLLRGRSPRQRAHAVFAHLHVWDTHHHSGVLIYVLLADRAIEILADRGIAAKVAESEWQAVCTDMQKHFAAGEFARGAIAGVAAVNAILIRHFPA